ncbi:MAG: peptidoglycan editing factor PgeF [Microcoleus sp.]
MTLAGNFSPNSSNFQGLVKPEDATWHWQNWEGLPYLTCSLLAPWKHGFFTQQFSPRGPIDLVGALNSEASVYRVKQVHGNTVLATGTARSLVASQTSETPVDTYPEADGLVAQRPQEAVWVCTADCVPVLVADDRTGMTAAVHAGWRGTAAKILPEAIAQLRAQGSQLENLRIAMGPAISGEVYQVSVEVAAQLGATVAPEDALDSPADILQFLHQLPEMPLLQDPEPGKVRLDVRRFNALQLQRLGVNPDRVAIAPYCTYSDADRFFSYRRDRLKKVQWSGIVSGGQSFE